MSTWDVIVVGCGAMGAATCAAVAGRGARVLGLERHAIPHASGSSHGQTRVMRLCYYEHPDYVPLLRRALDGWRTLDATLGESVFLETGGLYAGPPDGELVAGSARAAREHELPLESLDRDEVARRFPQFTLPDDFVAILEPSAGVLRPERIVAGYADLALRCDAELHGHERVIDWRVEDGHVRVRTDRGSYVGRHLVLCAGPWTNQVVGELGVELSVTRQIAGWVWPRRPLEFSPERMPIWGIEEAGSLLYGFPMIQGRPGVKIARHAPGEPTEVETVRRDVTPEDERDLRHIIDRYLPAADGPVLSLSVCLYTNSPDGHFIIDRHPKHDRVTLATGFSGHGFKFASVVGEILADLAIEGDTELPIGFLGLSRFAGDG